MKDFVRMPLLEDVLEAMRRFPQGSQVSFQSMAVYTERMYKGKCSFDLFAKKLPDWSKPDPVGARSDWKPIEQSRLQEIIRDTGKDVPDGNYSPDDVYRIAMELWEWREERRKKMSEVPDYKVTARR